MSVDCPEARKAEEELRSVLGVLERNGAGHTELLRGLLVDIVSGNRFTVREAFLKAGKLCDPKCLGDEYLKDISSAAWFAMLSRLEDACAAAFERLQE